MNVKADTFEKLNQDIAYIVEEYQDYTAAELFVEFGINDTAKNRLNALIKRMITYSNSIYLAQVEANTDMALKTIKLDKFGRLKESMSFPVFKYTDIVREEWENSSLRSLFKDKTFVFAVFKNAGKELFLNRIVVWEMPEDVLEQGIRPVWQRMRSCLQEGNIVKYIDDYGRYFSYFPAATENPYVHVRPHAQNRQDTLPLPVPDKLTGLVEYPKHCFWLNRGYILKILSKEE